MRPRLAAVLLALLVCLASGCGTLVNLWAPPGNEWTPPQTMMPATCRPFGGTARSLLVGGMPAVCGIEVVTEGGLQGWLYGPALTGAGLVVLVTELPLSFLGDVATLPIVHARQRGEPWAIWWGEQAAKPRDPVEAAPTPTPETPGADADQK
jgi:uncharacterized protein YceK